MVGGVRRYPTFIKHHPKYFCDLCRRCLRANPDGKVMPKYQCSCRKRPDRAKGGYTVPVSSMDFNTLPRALGLEVECSYLGTTKIAVPPFVHYQWTHDGSITPGGQEMVLAPLVGDQFLQGITAVAGEFEKYGFLADQTCGLHVHVGVPDWTAWELRRLIFLYAKFENLFYQLVEPGRDGARTNRHGEQKWYAKRWDTTQAWLDEGMALREPQAIRRWIIKSLYRDRLESYLRHTPDGKAWSTSGKPKAVFNGGHSYCVWPQPKVAKIHGFRNMPGISAHKYEACRYFGLNLHTFFQRNTVEYRHHEGTVALDKLLYWPLWCGWFTELASGLTDVEARGLTTIDQLLDTEWSRWSHKPLAIPQPVRDWVRRTLRERGHV